MTNEANPIFLAFIGDDIKQSKNILEIKDGFERWNLKKFKRNEFIEAIQTKIRPINENVIKFYREEDSGTPNHGITEEQFKQSSWGIFIPNTIGRLSYIETMFLLNLYSPNFLYPLFYVGDMGITNLKHNKNPLLYFHFQEHSIFNKNFVSFYELLLEQSEYANWNSYRVKKWGKEDWRLFAASLLYSGLKDYDYEKSSFSWQRESAETSIILESLFTAIDKQRDEIGYRLRKRIAVLLSEQFPEIEKDMKRLYESRSDFVHGSFFAQFGKKNKEEIPIPDFESLHKQKEYVRFALIAYFNLAKIIKTEGIGETKSVMDALEQAIINIDLRKKINKETKKIIELIPNPTLK